MGLLLMYLVPEMQQRSACDAPGSKMCLCSGFAAFLIKFRLATYVSWFNGQLGAGRVHLLLNFKRTATRRVSCTVILQGEK